MSQLNVSNVNTTILAVMRVWMACIQAMALLIDTWRRTMPRVLGGTAPRLPVRAGHGPGARCAARASGETPKLASNDNVDPETNARGVALASNDNVDPETNARGVALASNDNVDPETNVVATA